MAAAPASLTAAPPLCVADDETFWPWISWPRFAAWPGKESTVVVVPVVGLADWGLGHPLDAEETVLLPILKEACRQLPPAEKPLVVPPLRFVVGPDAGSAFAVDPPTAHALIAEVAAGIGAAGFRKVVLLNASPWNEELCGAAARDLRIGRGLQMFQVHLSALGLDFHPARSRSRRVLQTLLTHLHGRAPEPAEAAAPAAAAAWGDEAVRPLAGPSVPPEAAACEGAATLAAASVQLAKLLGDIRARAPLTASLAWT